MVIRLKIGIPQDMQIGEYDLHLKLADPEKRLRNRIEYMIRLANIGLWDQQTGLHDLKQKVAISPESQTAPFRGNVWFEKYSTASTRR